jgi:hypothetical protein
MQMQVAEVAKRRWRNVQLAEKPSISLKGFSAKN